MMALAKAAFAEMAGETKTLRNKALELIQDEDFLAGIKGITVKNGVVSRA
jgi:hypothetical protein